jgi:hypothetical protein
MLLSYIILEEDSILKNLALRISDLAKASAKRICDKDIQNDIPDLRPEQSDSIINKFLSKVFFFKGSVTHV